MIKIRRVFLHVACLTFMTIAVGDSMAQMPDFTKLPFVNKADSAPIADLIRNGVRVDGKAVQCWFPKDSMSHKRMREITHMIDRGIKGANKFIGAPLDWQELPPGKPITFYFRRDSFISHGSWAGFVSIPFWRIRDDKAPWLHEAFHEILAPRKLCDLLRKEANDSTAASDGELPEWLGEGLPDVLKLEVARKEGLSEYDVFSGSRNLDFDSAFRARLSDEHTRKVLPYIGVDRYMPELFSNERHLYASAFYSGSASFVKFLIARYGLPTILTVNANMDECNATLKKLTGKSIDTLRREWLEAMGI